MGLRRAMIVTDLGYGDCGKGTMTDFFTSTNPDSTLVIRHNGGGQAGHNVVTPNGRHHEFSHFGSGSFFPKAATFLSRHFMVDPIKMLMEADELRSKGVDLRERVYVDDEAIVVTPWHMIANQIREMERGAHRYGSCGYGIGEVQQDLRNENDLILRVKHLRMTPSCLRNALEEIRAFKRDEIFRECPRFRSSYNDKVDPLFGDDSMIWVTQEKYHMWLQRFIVVQSSYFEVLANDYEQLVFEGAQGVMLDEDFGFAPHNTWSKTTSKNARDMLSDIGYTAPVTTVGVIRSYSTRHGNGPFVSYSGEYTRQISDPNNPLNKWQGEFRSGPLDLVSTRYAIDVNEGVDCIAMTHVDSLASLISTGLDLSVCIGYRDSSDSTIGDVVIETISPHRVKYLGQKYTDRLMSPDVMPILMDPFKGHDLKNTSYARLMADYVGHDLGVPVTYLSAGPTHQDKFGYL